MYNAFYKLNTDPFCLSPDHRFCFRHRSFAKARAYLHFALQRAEGFVMITGAPGSGKTTLLNQLVSEVHAARYTIARLNTTQLHADDVLQMAAYAFRQNREGSTKAQLLHQLEYFLQQQHRADRRAVLIIDEAQDLSLDALEEVRLLTNLELDGRPLLQIFLVGQDQLQEKLSAPELLQLQQRMIAHTHLEPMSADESAAYIAHRLSMSGWNGDPEIADDVLDEIFAFSHGVPRRVNQICSRLFLYGMVEEKHQLDLYDVRHVLGELHEERLLPSEDEELFAARLDPSQLAQRQATENGQQRDPQPAPALRGVPRFNNNETPADRFGHVGALAGERMPPVRSEARQVTAKITPVTVSAKSAGAFGTAAAHKLEELPAQSTVPVVRRSAQIHELQRARPAIAPFSTGAAVQDSEQSVPIPAMNTNDPALSHANYRRQSQRQWRYALLLATGMLAAVLYALRMDMTAPPPSVIPMQNTGSAAPIGPPPIQKISQPAEPLTPVQPLDERLHQQGLMPEASGSGFLIDPGDAATFAFRSAAINDALRDVLDRITTAVRESHITLIRVTGYADASGSPSVNLNISQDRADNVAKYLMQSGIPATLLQTRARGAELPKSTINQDLNRRVEIYIEPASAGPA